MIYNPERRVKVARYIGDIERDPKRGRCRCLRLIRHVRARHPEVIQHQDIRAQLCRVSSQDGDASIEICYTNVRQVAEESLIAVAAWGRGSSTEAYPVTSNAL